MIAGLIPASKVEAQGAQRLQEAVKEHGQPVIDEAKSAAQQVGDQLKATRPMRLTWSSPVLRARPSA